MEYDDFIEHLDRDLVLIDAAGADLSRPVPSCPGWDAGRLIGHLGRVHRMALGVLENGSMVPTPADQIDKPPLDPDALRAYFQSSSRRLVEVLRDTSPFLACWTFLRGFEDASFWARRMAHEHSIHRVDAQQAAGGTVDPVTAALAVDGIREWFLIANERTLPRRDTPLELGGSIHLHCTDTDGEWMVRSDGAQLHVTEEHAKGDAAVRATASDLLLGLWGRLDLRTAPTLERFGDDRVIDALAGVGGA